MSKASANRLRVLAIDPSFRGFGFAVVEGPERLIDWGVKNMKQDKNTSCLTKIDKLIEHYQPEMIVIEDAIGKNSRRRLRVRQLIQQVVLLARRKKIKHRSFSRSTIQKTFSQGDVPTKHQIATIITKQFPELSRHLPRFRKAWMTEDWRMSIFNAMALAITFFCASRPKNERPA